MEPADTDHTPLGFYATFKEAADLVYSSASALMTAHSNYQFYVVGYAFSKLICLFQP